MGQNVKGELGQTKTLRIPIACDHCSLPAGHIVLRGTELAFEWQSRHHGHMHSRVITIGEIRDLVTKKLQPVIDLVVTEAQNLGIV